MSIIITFALGAFILKEILVYIKLKGIIGAYYSILLSSFLSRFFDFTSYRLSERLIFSLSIKVTYTYHMVINE